MVENNNFTKLILSSFIHFVLVAHIINIIRVIGVKQLVNVTLKN